MSKDEQTKRLRIKDSKENTEVDIIVKEDKKFDFTINANPSLEDFNWEEHSSGCPSTSRKPNPHIKTKHGDKVFSRESYAQELYDLMDQYYNNSENQLTFNIKVGETHKGKVHAVDTSWCSIDIGYREFVYVDLSRESADTKSKLIPGKSISVQVTGDRTSNKKGFILGSVEAGLKSAITREILESIEDGNTAYVGTVTGMIPNGGYFVNIQGVECFMPGSLAGINKLAEFESILNTQMYVVPMSYSPERGTVIVSHRKYLQALIPNKIEEVSSNMDVTRTGNVTGSAKYGIFVEFEGCLTGMIHTNDLDPETAKKHKAREIQPGDEISFKIKEVISNTKIMLTQVEKEEIIDPWKLIAEKYTTFPVEVAGVVKSIKDYGVFLDIGEGVVGLLHISEFPEGFDKDSIDKNDAITVKITRIDTDARKVFLQL
jgi:small subunit ribosomal protein S1